MIRRLVIMFMGSVVMGVVLTVGVAWGLSLWSPFQSFTGFSYHGPVESAFGGRLAGKWPDESWHESRIWGRGVRVDGWRDPVEWVRHMTHTRAGLPAHCLEGFQIWEATGETLVGMVPAPRWLGRDRFSAIGMSWTSPAIPLLPIWRGFGLNVVMYGTAVFLLWAGPGAIRRSVRKRRGRCVRCGYDLRGLPDAEAKCPECGR
jgi:hypothetical protein